MDKKEQDLFKNYVGVLEDKRKEVDKDKDYDTNEILAGVSDKKPWKVIQGLGEFSAENTGYFVYNQGRSFSCVFHAHALYAGIVIKKTHVSDGFLRLSPAAYAKKANKGRGAVSFTEMLRMLYVMDNNDLVELAKDPTKKMPGNPFPLYDYFPTNGLGEKDYDKFKKIPVDTFTHTNGNLLARKFTAHKIYGFDKERMKEAVDRTGGCPITLVAQLNGYFGYDVPEWKGGDTDLSHRVCVIGYGNYQGKDGFVIQDSAYRLDRNDHPYLRFLTVDYLEKACREVGVLHPTEISSPKIVKGMRVPQEKTNYGKRGKAVEALQKHLQRLGLLHKNIPYGYYGQLTADALYVFHLQYFSIFPTDYTDEEKRKITNTGGRWYGDESIRMMKKHADVVNKELSKK